MDGTDSAVRAAVRRVDLQKEAFLNLNIYLTDMKNVSCSDCLCCSSCVDCHWLLIIEGTIRPPASTDTGLDDPGSGLAAVYPSPVC